MLYTSIAKNMSIYVFSNDILVIYKSDRHKNTKNIKNLANLFWEITRFDPNQQNKTTYKYSIEILGIKVSFYQIYIKKY